MLLQNEVHHEPAPCNPCAARRCRPAPAKKRPGISECIARARRSEKAAALGVVALVALLMALGALGNNL